MSDEEKLKKAELVLKIISLKFYELSQDKIRDEYHYFKKLAQDYFAEVYG